MDKQNKTVQKKRIRKTGPNEKIPVKEPSFSPVKPLIVGFAFTCIFAYLLLSGYMDPVLRLILNKNSDSSAALTTSSTTATATLSATTSVAGASSESVLTSLPPKRTFPPKITPSAKAVPTVKNAKKENEPGFKVSGGKTSSGSKGWIKEIVKPGDGKTFPKKGDVVTMHYVGKLTNGKVFDSSRKRNQPFKTVIGVGRVIRGWDEGVPTMSLGESAVLTIHSEYGYGVRGAGASIPPNSELIFEVELLEITRKN